MHTMSLAADTAALLLPENAWTATPDPAWGGDQVVRITHSDGRSIRIQPARRNGYIHASVIYPHPSHFHLHAAHEPTTEMRADRGAAALAKAITRKLLEVYTDTYAQVLAANTAYAELQQQEQRFAERLTEIIPGARITSHQTAVTVKHNGPAPATASIQVSGGQHTVTLRWVGSATAEAAARAYAETVTTGSGAAPRAEKLRAEAEQLRTELAEARALAAHASEYRVLLPDIDAALVVRRQPRHSGDGWSVEALGHGGGRAWTAEGWQHAFGSLRVDRLFCWPSAAAAIDEARNALAEHL
ncbi:hypothetical protein ABT127_34620 [Streptomyces sp. NPDC001904]|uniref:hypothetical protein n=1 Tax=Streptomyces sp. NPDC001904 TaxID=3154531 RepID=UPI00331744C2